MAKQTRRQRQSSTTINTTGGAVRITQSDSPRNKPTVKDKSEVVVEMLTPRVVEGFVGFLKDYAVVGLAIGFIVGQQANGVVKSLVDSIITPLVQVLIGEKIQDKVTILHHGGKPIELHWGAFVYTLLQMIIILFVIYVIVKVTRLDKLKKIEDKK